MFVHLPDRTVDAASRAATGVLPAYTDLQRHAIAHRLRAAVGAGAITARAVHRALAASASSGDAPIVQLGRRLQRRAWSRLGPRPALPGADLCAFDPRFDAPGPRRALARLAMVLARRGDLALASISVPTLTGARLLDLVSTGLAHAQQRAVRLLMGDDAALAAQAPDDSAWALSPYFFADDDPAAPTRLLIEPSRCGSPCVTVDDDVMTPAGALLCDALDHLGGPLLYVGTPRDLLSGGLYETMLIETVSAFSGEATRDADGRYVISADLWDALCAELGIEDDADDATPDSFSAVVRDLLRFHAEKPKARTHPNPARTVRALRRVAADTDDADAALRMQRLACLVERYTRAKSALLRSKPEFSVEPLSEDQFHCAVQCIVSKRHPASVYAHSELDDANAQSGVDMSAVASGDDAGGLVGLAALQAGCITVLETLLAH